MWVECEDGASRHKLADDVVVNGSVCYRKGQYVKGNAHDTRNRPVLFDGNVLHFTKRFVRVASDVPVERYAVIYFCQGRFNERTPSMARDYLKGLGFNPPQHIEQQVDGTPAPP